MIGQDIQAPPHQAKLDQARTTPMEVKKKIKKKSHTTHISSVGKVCCLLSHFHVLLAGFYLYIEGDGVTHGDSARMLSSVCLYSGPMCLHFWYHMYGSATAMALNIYLLQSNGATKIWSQQNNQGPLWQTEQVEITASGPYQVSLRFLGM